MSRDINIDLSNAKLYNPVYLPFLKSRSRYLLAYGGRDSAKSHTVGQKIIINVLSERYCKVVCLRKIYADIKDSQFDALWSIINAWGLEDEFSYTKAPLEIKCKNGNIILARGLDRPAKIKSMTNPTIIWMEEADEPGYKDFITSDTSIRSSSSDALLQMILTFNPEQEEGWICREFFPPSKGDYEKPDGKFNYVESPKPNTLILHTTYHDNAWCPPERGRRYEELKFTLGNDNNYYKVYCLGLWGSALRGLCYENVGYQDAFPGLEEWKLHGYGLDFGFTNHPSTVIEIALCHGNIYLEEIVYKTGLVNCINAKEPGQPNIEKELNDNEIGGNDLIIADAAEPKSIRELQNAGFSIQGVAKPPGSVRTGVAFCRRYRIIVCGESPNLKKEFRTYKFAEDKDGSLTNEPVKAWDHGMDAFRYWVMYHLMNRGGVTRGRVKGLL